MGRPRHKLRDLNRRTAHVGSLRHLNHKHGNASLHRNRKVEVVKLEHVRQVPPGDPPHRLEYEVADDVLTVRHTGGGQVSEDVFDFTGTPDGALDVDTIETDLPVQPILAAERVDGQLTVTVLDWRW